MKKKLIILGFLLCVIHAGADTVCSDSFRQANQLYENGEFSKALSTYETIESGCAHWKLFYNMGNCHYKLENYIKSKIYYLKARKLKPFHPSIEKNLSIVNGIVAPELAERKVDFVGRVVLKIESFIGINLVSVFLLIMVFLLNGFILLLIIRGRRKFLLYGISFSLIITLVVFGYHQYRIKKWHTRDTAVIIQPDSQLRSGPGENNTVLFKLNPGVDVRILEQSRNWARVAATSQIAGWIQMENLDLI